MFRILTICLESTTHHKKNLSFKRKNRPARAFILLILIICIFKSNYSDSIKRIDDRILLTTSFGGGEISTVNPCSSFPSVSRSENCDLSIPAFMKWLVRFSIRSLIRAGEPERWTK